MSKSYHITTGDIDGIGLEISLKALKKVSPKIKKENFFIWCHYSQKKIVLSFLKKHSSLNKSSQFINNFSVSKTFLKFNFILNSDNTPAHWFTEAVKDCILNKSSVITAPLSKTQIKAEGLNDVGHTEILKRMTDTTNLKMCFFGKYFSIILFTDHIPINKIKITEVPFVKFLKSCKQLHFKFKNKKSNIHVLGLNPHAGDSGIIGNEDASILRWARSILDVEKLIPADSAFVNFKKFKHSPTFISLYHDQGLIPFKMAHGYNGYHYTMGLPFVRTSVDHGTAKDIFGKNSADFQSMTDAILAAIKLSKNKS